MICEQKINSYNMLIKELMKELGYYTEEEYNINTELNKRHYDNIMNSDIKIDMKTLSAIKASLNKRPYPPSDLCGFKDVIYTLEEWIDEEKKYLIILKFPYPFPDIVDMCYELYCERKEIDIMNNPKLAPLLQKIKKIKNFISNLYEMRIIEYEI